VTTVNLVPTGAALVGGAGTAYYGAGSYAAALTDASDSSYAVVSDEYMGTLIMDMSTTTLPAGAVPVATTVNFRAGSAYSNVPLRVYVNGDTINWYTYPVQGTSANYTFGATPASGQAAIDGMQIVFQSGYAVIDELNVDVRFALLPSVSVSGPSGAVTTTTTPTVTWVHTSGNDATSGQTAYQVRVFTAAQYGIGGFDPGASPCVYDSGVVASASSSIVLPALTNTTTFRAYVHTTQTSNGQYQWSPFAYTQFNVAVSTSDIASVTVTPDNANARNTVLITRNTGTPTWTNYDLQRTVDGGASWQTVRGSLNKAVTGTSVTVQDYETANTQTVTYRARAGYTAGGFITGAWVSSSSSAGWTSTSMWLKDPYNPARNLIVNNVLMPEPVYPRVRGVFNVLGSPFPVVVSDVLSAGRSTITLETYTAAEVAPLKLLCSGAVLLLQAPAVMGWDSRYVAPGDLTEMRVSQTYATPWLQWQLQLDEVDVPAVVA
jgi:hypothetical protein